MQTINIIFISSYKMFFPFIFWYFDFISRINLMAKKITEDYLNWKIKASKTRHLIFQCLENVRKIFFSEVF